MDQEMMTGDVLTQELKGRVIKEVDSLKEQIFEISQFLYENPEVGHQEYKSAHMLTSTLERHSFNVQKGVSGMETAFKAEFAGKEPGPKIALLAEYDALPAPLGHGCQHNLISAMSVGAGLALSRIMPELKGSLYVFGCPAEEAVAENAGGKVIMIDEFKAMDAAMMIHGSTRTTDGSEDLLNLNREALEITFHGKAASAAQADNAYEGVNALEACMLFWHGLNSFRPHIKHGARVYGIITEGGTAVNVIPHRAVTRLLIRVSNYRYFLELIEKVKQIAEGAAMTLGATVDVRITANRYISYIASQNLAEAYGRNIEKLGLTVTKIKAGGDGGASDIGNVSRVCPSIHAFIESAPKGTANHTNACADASVSELGRNAAIAGAKALCMTAIDIFTGAVDVKRLRQELDKALLDNASATAWQQAPVRLTSLI
ncbi:amidohydrolase [Comamonadaceae bacterium G21597-S1]|nr:amidohydrolase [Comamonadaceae bacterium G21597-S1]